MTEDSKVIIAVSELMVSVIGAIVSGPGWRGRMIFYVGDNQSVITCLETRKSRDAYARFLFISLQIVENRYECVVIGFYIRSRHNKT